MKSLLEIENFRHNMRYFLGFLVGILLLTSCNKNSTNPDNPQPPTGEWKLVFSDEFEGTAYNTKNWNSYQTQSWSAAWNKYVIPNDASLSEVKDGNLYLRARWNKEKNLPETGAIQSLNKFSFKYGKLEVRAKFTRSGQGGWPAIWLMPQNEIFKGWPDCGEIDIMERLNNDGFVYQVIHQSSAEKVELKPSPYVTVTINTSDYNVFGIIKSENKIEFYVNGVISLTHSKSGVASVRWPFETDFYLIMNYACADKGDSGINFWPGKVTSTDGFPYEMAIDWVKIYSWEEKK